MQFTDRLAFDGLRQTEDGYLVADVRVARTGLQEYLGVELGRPDLSRVAVYRPEEEVFGRDAMNSYAHRPVSNDHPPVPVNASNWKDYAVGQTGGDVVRDGEFVRVPMVLMDAKTIKDVQGGKRELSMGYDAEVIFVDGTTPDGKAYQAVQRGMKMNHLAIVDAARGGNQLRIGDKRDPVAVDHAHPPKPIGGHLMADNRKVVIDGLTIETTEQGAQALEKLQRQLKDSSDNWMKEKDAMKKEMDAKDAELATKDAELEKMKAGQMSDAQIDARVAARADLITKAKLVADADYTGKSEAEIRKAAVTVRIGDAAIAGKSEAYIEARFDALLDSKPDPVRVALATRDGSTAVNDNGYAKSVADLQKGAQ